MSEGPRGMNPEPEGDKIEELAKEIRRLIESNRQFLARVNDEEFGDEDDAAEPETDEDAEDYEEL